MDHFYPDPNVDVNPKFTAGEKVVKLTNSSLKYSSTQVINSVSEDKYLSSGSIQTIENNVSSVKNLENLETPCLKTPMYLHSLENMLILLHRHLQLMMRLVFS